MGRSLPPRRCRKADATGVSDIDGAPPECSLRVSSRWSIGLAGIGKTVVALRVFGDDLDPAEVTRLLGAEPTAFGRKGDVRALPSGRDVVSRTGSWRLSVEDRSPGDLNGQLLELFSMLTPDLSVWQELRHRYKCDVFCGLFLDGANEGEQLEAETLSGLGSRGLALGLDIYDASLA